MIIETREEIFGKDFVVVANLPDKNEVKTAISLYISPISSISTGCYVYSIQDAHRRQVYTTVLQDDMDQELVEQTINMSKLTTKKFGKPCYVNMSVPTDSYLVLQKRIIDLLTANMC